jgi:hypothetical protein
VRGVLVLVAVSACGPGLKQADTHDVGRDMLVEASGDANALGKLLQGTVVDAGLYFADATCAAQFGAAREIVASSFQRSRRVWQDCICNRVLVETRWATSSS